VIAVPEGEYFRALSSNSLRMRRVVAASQSAFGMASSIRTATWRPRSRGCGGSRAPETKSRTSCGALAAACDCAQNRAHYSPAANELAGAPITAHALPRAYISSAGSTIVAAGQGGAFPWLALGSLVSL